MSQAATNLSAVRRRDKRDSKSAVLEHASNELVFAVVGHVGSGTSAIATTLADLLREASATSPSYDVEVIKATEVISEWAKAHGKEVPLHDAKKKTLKAVEGYQDLGDAMREETMDHSAVAKSFALRIRALRAEKLKVSPDTKDPVMPDGAFRAYILDSIRHPAEVELLRHIYQDAFFLIGVVCEEKKRLFRVTDKYDDAGHGKATRFMQRDAKAGPKHGQRVSDAFHLADFFVDNTADRHKEDKSPNPDWSVTEKLSRLLKIIRHSEIVRPETSETAMLHAHGAAIRSACLSRQVGAAIVDASGTIIATGCNEVPKAGGGAYGSGFSDNGEDDHRCAYRQVQGHDKPFCSNTREQNAIIDDLLADISTVKQVTPEEKIKLASLFKTGRIGSLLEFSRAVHAEMDAIIAAARKGVSTIGCRLFVTTFPCHYCARHLVAAGIDEVQYIEPYPKSQALDLHSDSIQVTEADWQIPSGRAVAVSQDNGAVTRKPKRKVLFRPFTGVAPRLYRRAFGKDRDLKDDATGEQRISSPDWGSPWHLRRMSYAQLEAELFGEGWA